MDTTELADRLAIAETLALYCRGIDRCDPEQLAAAFTPDALIDYGDGARPVADVIPALMAGLGAMRLTQHNISNTVMRISGDRASAETHCVALHITPAPPE
ncbi:MAG: nuclear transport factor 2 family protein, partial [Porphyrobacter sp.]|nr:nuclear transport factor 2 family protein [Porphyrobacter sp.]